MLNKFDEIEHDYINLGSVPDNQIEDVITSARNTDAQKLADVLEDYLRNRRQLDELNVTGKECTGIDFTGGGKCDGSIKFEGENTYGKPARRRPNFVLCIRPSEDDKKEKQFAKPEHVDLSLIHI